MRFKELLIVIMTAIPIIGCEHSTAPERIIIPKISEYQKTGLKLLGPDPFLKGRTYYVKIPEIRKDKLMISLKMIIHHKLEINIYPDANLGIKDYTLVGDIIQVKKGYYATMIKDRKILFFVKEHTLSIAAETALDVIVLGNCEHAGSELIGNYKRVFLRKGKR